MSEIDYLWERMNLAVQGMACSSSTIQQRIADAYIEHLHDFKEEDFPEELRSEFAEIRGAMTSRAVEGGDAGIRESAASMSREEAEQLARDILKLYDQVLARHTDFLSTDFPDT